MAWDTKALNFARIWWRPIFSFIAVGTILVNGIVLPLITHSLPDLTGLSTLIGAVATLYVARTYEVTKGRADSTTTTTTTVQPPADEDQPGT